MQEPLADGRVVAVADRGHHVPAIVAEVLHGLLARDVSLVRHEDREDEDERADDQGDHPALETSLGLEREGGPRGGHGGSMRHVVKYPWVGKSSVSGIPNDRRDPISPRAPTGRKGFSMWPTARTIAILLTLGLASGAAALGVNAFLSSSGDAGSDHGLDTDGDGRFDWLVVEAQVVLPEAGTWDVYASLSAESASASSCGSWYRQPLPVMETGPLSVPIASTYERYFFPSGAQSVRMAFDGEDIVRAEADGPYVVQASLTLGGWIAYADTRPFVGPASGVEWSYTTGVYRAADFDEPIRNAFFTGGHSDLAVDVDGDGGADFLELRADVRVNVPGRYSLNGMLSQAGSTWEVLMFIGYGYRDVSLTTSDSSVYLRFRGDQIRQAAIDGPWNFTLTLFGPFEAMDRLLPPGPSDGILPPEPMPIPETLCGTTSAYPARDFDETMELLRYTGRFEEATPDRDGDGLHDALVVRAEVEVFLTGGFDLEGALRGPSSTIVARTYGQTWLDEGGSWTEFAFAGSDIRAGRVDGPYEATLSITPSEWGIDPTTSYTTGAYRAEDFDDDVPSGPGIYWIGNLTAAGSGSSLALTVSVVRGSDFLAVVYEDSLLVTVTDDAGAQIAAFREWVVLESGGTVKTFAFAVDGLEAGTYVVTAVLGAPDAPVDSRTVRTLL